MRIIINDNDLITLEKMGLMWEVEEGIPTPCSPTVGEEYGHAVAHKCYSWGEGAYTDFCLYETHSKRFGEVYLLTVNYDDGEEVSTRRLLLPKWEGLTIEVAE